MTFSTIATDNMDRGNKILDFDMQNKHVVFINSNKPFWLVFLGHELAYKNRPLPTSVRILSSSFYPITVKRTDIDTITMTATPAFQFDSEPVTEQDFSGHHAYLTLHLMGLLRSKDEPWSIGPIRAYEDLSIGIDSLFNHKPKTLRVQWDSNKPKDYLWLYWNKAENQYQLFVMPEVGQEIKLPGMF